MSEALHFIRILNGENASEATKLSNSALGLYENEN
jgi:hypothetical protein